MLKLGVGLDLEELTPLLARRIGQMLGAGALDEARAAMAVNADPSAPGWTGIGCAECLAHLRGELDLDQCVRRWAANTGPTPSASSPGSAPTPPSAGTAPGNTRP